MWITPLRRRWLGFALLPLLCGACSKDPETAPALKADASTRRRAAERPASVTTPPLELTQTTESPTPTTPKAAAENPPPTAPSTPPGPGTDGGSVPFTPTEVKGLTNIILVVDGSGSMNGPIESETKIAYAQSVVKDMLVQPAPGGMRRSFGVMAFGAQAPASANNCEDVTTISPLGPINPTTIGPALDAIKPQGTSAIAYALQQAAEQLPNASDDADNMLILIADGVDTCNADPCLAAEQIKGGPKKAMIHVIGFDLDQKAEQQLRCVTEKADGRFFLARNVPELRTAADQALNANLPYNLRIKVFAGSLPLNTEMTVYRAGTQQIVERGRSAGIKFFQLQPGSYDIMISYVDSVEEEKPSKLLKGVEVQATARAEQIVHFDLGYVELAGIDPNGRPTSLDYTLHKAGQEAVLARFPGAAGPKQIALRPGTYTIGATGPTINGVPLHGVAENIQIKVGDGAEHTFRFETGELFLRGETGRGEFVALHYEIVTPEQTTQILASGELPAAGGPIPLPVGTYIVRARPLEATLGGPEAVELPKLSVPARDRVQQLVSFRTGTVTLLGHDSSGQATKTEFRLRRAGVEDAEPLVRIAEGTAQTIELGPGPYHITAVRLSGQLSPQPTLVWENIQVQADTNISKIATFELGTLALASQDAKGVPLSTEFALFRSGDEDKPLATEIASSGTMSFPLTPGLYDIRARDVSARGTIKPTLWLKGIAVAVGTVVERAFQFTAGRVRLVCRGTNDAPLACSFRLFTYGQDAPLYAGDTEAKWQEFEMRPGGYYLEVGYFDAVQDHVLKKWITVTVAENETVEEIVRF